MVVNASWRSRIFCPLAQGATMLILLFGGPICLKAGQLDGQGLICVGLKAPGEDLFYGFVFDNGRVVYSAGRSSRSS